MDLKKKIDEYIEKIKELKLSEKKWADAYGEVKEQLLAEQETSAGLLKDRDKAWKRIETLETTTVKEQNAEISRLKSKLQKCEKKTIIDYILELFQK